MQKPLWANNVALDAINVAREAINVAREAGNGFQLYGAKEGTRKASIGAASRGFWGQFGATRSNFGGHNSQSPSDSPVGQHRSPMTP